MTLYEILQGLGMPCAYSHFRSKNPPKNPPYIVYTGSGQDNFKADNTFYHSENRYQVEYYFTEKNEEQEAAIESALLENGYLYTKSDDVFIDDEGIFVIYYNI